MTPLEIVRIPALSDNYVWLVHDPASGETLVVDPAEAEPVLAEARGAGLDDRADLEHALAPRSHRRQCGDQGGDRRDASRARRPRRRRSRRSIAPSARAMRCGSGDHAARVLETPAHTAGHIAFISPTTT